MSSQVLVPGNGTRRAFTLIELLVVIAIIAILAAILFPVFAQAREKARSISCLSNLKQVGLSVMQYEQDFEETTPNGVNPYGGGNGWAGQVYTYVRSVNVFHCPSDDTQTTPFSSYGFNKDVSIPSPTAPSGSPSSYTLSQYAAPARTVLLFEVANSGGFDITLPATNPGSDNYVPYFGGSAAGNGNGGAYDPGGYNAQPSAGTPQDGFIKYATGFMNGVTATNQGSYLSAKGRHTEGSNYLMVDGHAKWLRGSQVSPGYNAASETATQTTGGEGATAAGTSGAFPDGKIPSVTFSVR